MKYRLESYTPRGNGKKLYLMEDFKSIEDLVDFVMILDEDLRGKEKVVILDVFTKNLNNKYNRSYGYNMSVVNA